MKIKTLSLTNFRNWRRQDFEFSERVVIFGDNAQGKTNVLEAIFFAATTKSFRGKDQSVITEGEDFAKIEAKLDKNTQQGSEIVFKKTESGKIEKEYRINDKIRPSIDFVGEFATVVFSPDDLLLVSGAPDIKRRYMSFTIGQNDREYLFDLLNYRRVLRQRNELLKRAGMGTIEREIDVWDENLAEFGEKIIEKRHELEEVFNKKLSFYWRELSGEEKRVDFEYLPALWGKSLLESLAKSRERDFFDKYTNVGPHRDSWKLKINEKDVVGFASRGEYRTLILALKLCERDFALEKKGELPVVLLDDVFSELDMNHRRYLVEAFTGAQIIITTTDLDHLDESFRASTQQIKVPIEE